jgi:hypothetical protein
MIIIITQNDYGPHHNRRRSSRRRKNPLDSRTVGRHVPPIVRPNATYVTYDSETTTAQLCEVEYDYHKTCADILSKGLPPIFAWRLSQGMEFAERADDPSHVCER